MERRGRCGKSAGDAAEAARQAWQDVTAKVAAERQKIIDDRTRACQNRDKDAVLVLSNQDCVLLPIGTDADRERISVISKISAGE